jgi:hypothetical protein
VMGVEIICARNTRASIHHAASQYHARSRDIMRHLGMSVLLKGNNEIGNQGGPPGPGAGSA